MNSISRGFRLVKASWTVVRQDRQLLLLPVISFSCSVVVMAVFALGAVGIGLPDQGETPSPGLYVLAFLLYLALSFVTIYFNAAVIGTAMKRLQGEDASISEGLRLARANIGRLFVWALITATVGMILRAIQERAGVIGRLLIGIVGVAWSVITYFVVPVVLYEPLGVPDAIKRSASIFRQRWGEQFVGVATIGLAIFLISLPIVLVGGALSAAIPVVGIPLLVLSIGILAAVGAACSGVFNAAPYRYATTSESSGAFSTDDLNGAFRPRRGSSGSSPRGFSGEGFPHDPPSPPRPDAG
jgi:hypothetical protein